MNYRDAWQNAIDAVYDETIKANPQDDREYETFNRIVRSINTAFAELTKHIERRD